MSKRTVLSATVAVLAILWLGGPPAVAEHVEAEKNPATQLYIRTVPSGARIVIDGQPQGVSDRLIALPKDAGRVDLEIHMDGYEAERQDVAIAEGKITRVVVRLKKGESLTLSTEPPKAQSGDRREQPALGRATVLPSIRAPRVVRLVIGRDEVTLAGKKTTWEELPKLLEAVPDREKSVLEIGVIPVGFTDKKEGERLEERMIKAVLLAKKLRFKEFLIADAETNADVLKLQVAADQVEARAKALRGQQTSLRKFVRLVIGKDTMTFEGQETSWENLPKLLEAVPDRPHTVLELARASDEIPEQTVYSLLPRGVMLAKKFGFEYLSDIGVQPPGSKGSAPQPRTPVAPPNTDLRLHAVPKPPFAPEPPARGMR